MSSKNNKNITNLHHKRFFTAGILAFFTTGALIGGFFLLQFKLQNNFTNALHIYKPGQVLANAFYEVRIDNIARTKGEAGSLMPSKDKDYLVIDVFIKNKSNKTLDFFPVTQTYIKDNTGKTYSIGAAIASQPLQIGNVISGDSIKGQIIYDVPKDIVNPRYYIEGLSSKPLIIEFKQ